MYPFVFSCSFWQGNLSPVERLCPSTLAASSHSFLPNTDFFFFCEMSFFHSLQRLLSFFFFFFFTTEGLLSPCSIDTQKRGADQPGDTGYHGPHRATDNDQLDKPLPNPAPEDRRSGTVPVSQRADLIPASRTARDILHSIVRTCHGSRRKR